MSIGNEKCDGCEQPLAEGDGTFCAGCHAGESALAFQASTLAALGCIRRRPRGGWRRRRTSTSPPATSRRSGTWLCRRGRERNQYMHAHEEERNMPRKQKRPWEPVELYVRGAGGPLIRGWLRAL